MKTAFILLIGVFLSLLCGAQNFILTFEDTTLLHTFYHTDNLLDPQHIWQVGVPHKAIFDSAFSPTHVLVTLTDSALPASTTASFIISLPGTSDINNYEGAFLIFHHKFDFDTAHGAGYVEFSVDSGVHWHPVYADGLEGGYLRPGALCLTSLYYQDFDGQYLYPPGWWGYVPDHRTATGIPCFTGTDSLWISDTIVVPAFVQAKTNQYVDLIFRFTASTDSLSSSREGWMIDDISYIQNGMNCALGLRDVSSSLININPNPVADAFTLKMENANTHEYEISIIDMTGRVILNLPVCDLGQVTTCPYMRGDIAAGTYIIRLKDKSSGDTMEKRLVFE